MPGRVPAQVKAARARRMRDVADAGSQAFRRRFLGREVEVLWESSRRGDEETIWRGLTEHYLRVETLTPSERDLSNRFGRVRIKGLTQGGLYGQLVELESGG
jgi:threonylcarbamoyladenosine tRNA methylthiotransferase MtaB